MTLRERLAPLRSARGWRFGAGYRLGFGAYVGRARRAASEGAHQPADGGGRRRDRQRTDPEPGRS